MVNLKKHLGGLLQLVCLLACTGTLSCDKEPPPAPRTSEPARPEQPTQPARQPTPETPREPPPPEHPAQQAQPSPQPEQGSPSLPESPKEAAKRKKRERAENRAHYQEVAEKIADSVLYIQDGRLNGICYAYMSDWDGNRNAIPGTTHVLTLPCWSIRPERLYRVHMPPTTR